jgi:hypothetical protein
MKPKLYIRILFVGICLLTYKNIMSQREGHVWVFGDYTGLDFNSGIAIPIPSKVHGYPPATGGRLHNATYSDNVGNLKFYENAILSIPGYIGIYDKNDSLVKGPEFSTVNQYIVDSRFDTRFLPFRGTHKTAYVYIDIYPPRSTLNYIVLSDTMRDALGGVWDDSVRVVSKDSIVSIGLGCVRHANGRDWWVVTHEFLSDTFITALFTLDTAYVVHKQAIGTYQGIFSSSYTSGAGGSVIKFDKSGNKMLRANGECLLETYDFDRCSGLLSNVKVISPPVATFGHLDAEFSPNGNYVYVVTWDSISWNQKQNRLYQFDVNNPDVNNNYFIVDSGYSPYIADFMYLARGPDDKIYINVLCGTNCPRDSNYISVIVNPDLPGVSCNILLNGLFMAGMKVPGLGLPHHPDYTIGPIDGSSCDTLGLDEYPPIVYSANGLQSEPVFVVYPNPAKDYLMISGKELESVQKVRLYSVQGRQLLSSEPEWLSGSQQILRMSGLNPGIYFLELDYGKGVYRQKVWVE